MAAPSKQCESDSESVSFTLGYNWQEAGRGYHLSCHWAIVMGNGSCVRACVFVCEHVRVSVWKRVFMFLCWCRCVHLCVCVCHSRQQMELHANWVEISGGVWSRLTRGWAAAPGLGSLPPLAPRLVFWLLVPGCFPSLHLPIHPWITPSDQEHKRRLVCSFVCFLLPLVHLFALAFHLSNPFCTSYFIFIFNLINNPLPCFCFLYELARMQPIFILV